MQNPILSCSNVSFSIEDHKILHDISFSVFPNEVVALVGSNGVGKSTLIKIIAKDYFPDIKIEHGIIGGKIQIITNKTVAYFPQEISSKNNDTKIREYLHPVDTKELKDLGLNQNILDKKIRELSGGEKSKINLLRIKNTKTDLYILDEPTNNLDYGAIKYLESIIKENKKSAFIIVSHDRQLMENFADRIVEIDWYTRDSIIYPGPFSKYIELRKQKINKEWQKYNDYLTQKDKLKFSLQEKKQWSLQAEKGPRKTDNEKMLAGNMKDWSSKVIGKSIKNANKKLDDLEIVERPKEVLSINYPINVDKRSGDLIFELKDIEIYRGQKNIGPLDIKIQFGEKLIILGNNGSGKTTLLKMLTGDLVPNKGKIRTGSNITIGYLPQESQLENKNIIDIVKQSDPEKETEFRKLLNNFGITKDEIKKNINDLSPGERSRFLFASIIAKKPNCLILDEPTNHLDIFVLDFLEEALKNYKGTTIIVSHDRYFLSKIGEYRVFDFNKI